ncbi:MAG TPA: MarR family transcriptional regulator [Candidatus Atribacteria bacterium]|nr:MarR family transcriptional regulator [Candidatus Atribacteria bacterium]
MDVHSKYLHKYYGLSSPQLTILKELSDVNEIPTGELAKRVSLSQATVTDILDRLEEKGLIIRQRSSFDKRRVYIQISEKGKAIVLKNPSLLKEDFILQFNELEDWEQTLILSSMQRVVAMMKTPDIEIKNKYKIKKKELV